MSTHSIISDLLGGCRLLAVQLWPSLASPLVLQVQAVSCYEASLALTFYLIELPHATAWLLLSTSSLFDTN